MDKENEIQIGANAIEDNENSDSIHASGKDEGVVEEMEIVEVYEESNKADGMSLVERSLLNHISNEPQPADIFFKEAATTKISTMHTTARDEGNMVDLGKSEQLKVQVPVTPTIRKEELRSSSQKQRSLENEIAEMLAGGICIRTNMLGWL